MIFLLLSLLCAYVHGQDLTIHEVSVPSFCKKVAETGRGVWIKYAVYIDESSATGEKGKIIDSKHANLPFHFILGKRAVIEGIDKGVEGMCVGGRRLLIIPPNMAFGDRGQDDIVPPGATLGVVVDLVQVMKNYDFNNVFSEIDLDKDDRLNKYEVSQFFDRRGQPVPSSLWSKEDKNRNGYIEWSEFTGTKGVRNIKNKS